MKRVLPLTRRTPLAGLTALTIAGKATGQTSPASGAFLHGIASGDPDATSVVLWIRITTPADVEVECEVATDAAFQNIVWRARQMASADRDFTTKFLASRLKPGARYHYRFRSGNEVSRAGQTRTLPAGRVERLGIALGTAGITSPGDFVESGFDRATAAKLDAAFTAHNPEVLWTDNLHQGDVRLELTRAVGRATFVGVDNIATRRYRTFPISQWQVVRGAEGLDLKRSS